MQMIGHRNKYSEYTKLIYNSKESLPMQEGESSFENNLLNNSSRFTLIDRARVLNNALKDPLNPAYVYFASSYVKTLDASEDHNDVKEYLDMAVRCALKNPFDETAENVVVLWETFSQKIGIPGFQRDNVMVCFERNKLLALKKHPNVVSLFPLEIRISGNGYVLMDQESRNTGALIFHGCAVDDVQRVLEFRLYSSSTKYDEDFDVFRMNMQLKDYDTKIGLMVLESLVSDPNVLLNFQNYSNLWLQSFISNNKHNMVAARMNPLDEKAQSFMHEYITVAESMQFTKTQCMAVVDAFLKDLIDASIGDDPLSLYNEKCIQNWLLRYREYYAEAEIEHCLERFYSGKWNYIRFSEPELLAEKFPIEIKIGKRDCIITKELGRGGYGTAFSAYMKGFPGDHLVIKVLFPDKPNSRESFFNEIVALSQLKRLVVYDASQFVICQKKINGNPLDVVLSSCIRGSEQEKNLAAKYMKLGRTFYDKYGLIHGDVRPENVIVDDNQNLELIDFGMTKSASIFGPNALAYLEKDILKSSNEYELFFSRIEAQRALVNPKEKDSKQRILEYIFSLQKTNRAKDLQIWTKYYQQTYSKSN